MSPPSAFDATREDIAFASGGELCAGWLYRPAGDATVPLIGMAQGFSDMKEQGLAGIAERFRDAGFAVLVFDFRHFGASDGALRGQLFPLDMGEDYRCTISWAPRQPRIDASRVGLWGTSFSGGIAGTRIGLCGTCKPAEQQHDGGGV